MTSPYSLKQQLADEKLLVRVLQAKVWALEERENELLRTIAALVLVKTTKSVKPYPKQAKPNLKVTYRRRNEGVTR